MKFNTTLRTDGKGLWSDTAKNVDVIKIEVSATKDNSDDSMWGEMRVFFDTETWNTKQHGLIYTDRQFENQLKVALFALGLDAKDVGYSEQGMQGNDYVSLDVDDTLINSFEKVSPGEIEYEDF